VTPQAPATDCSSDLLRALIHSLRDSVGLIGHRLSAAVSTIWHRRRVECRRDL